MNKLTDVENPKVLMKNNILIQSKYSLDLNENKIFLLILYKLQKDYDGSMCCYIKYSEFKEIIKRTNDRTVAKIRQYLKSLRNKWIHFVESDENGTTRWGEYNFISGFEFDERTQTFKIECPKAIYNLLNEYLKTGYTPANLALLFSLKNYNAQRLYDLIRLWSGTKQTISYTVEDIKMYLMLEDNYSGYSNFKRRVIEPAIKELNNTGFFDIHITEDKVGKRITTINFHVKDLDKRTYFAKDDIATTISDIEHLCNVETSEESINVDVDKIDSVENKEIGVKRKEVVIGSQMKEVFIPDEDVLYHGTKRKFKKDFAGIDFTNKYMEKAFDDAVMITLDRDAVDIIKSPSYEFFKSTLDNKIQQYKEEERKDLEHEKEMRENWHV